MKGEILRERLLADLRAAGHVINESAVLPILGCVRLELYGDGQYRVVASDLEIGYKRDGGLAHVEEPGAVAVSYRALTDWLASVGGDKVTLDLKVRPATAIPQALNVKCGRNEANLKGVFPAEDYVSLQPPGPPVATMAAEDLVLMIMGVAWAAGSDNLAGVALEIGSQLRLVATDRSVVALWDRPVIELHSERAVVVLAESLMRVRSLLAGNVQICIDESANAVTFVGDDKEVVVQTLAATFPKYQGSGESARANPLHWRVETKALKALLRTGAGFAASDAHPYLRLAWQPGDPSSVEMEITHQRGDLIAAMDGEDGDVGKMAVVLSIRYLVKAISTMTADVIEIRLPDSAAGAIYFGDGEEAHEVIMMPMQLKRSVV